MWTWRDFRQSEDSEIVSRSIGNQGSAVNDENLQTGHVVASTRFALGGMFRREHTCAAAAGRHWRNSGARTRRWRWRRRSALCSRTSGMRCRAWPPPPPTSPDHPCELHFWAAIERLYLTNQGSVRVYTSDVQGNVCPAHIAAPRHEKRQTGLLGLPSAFAAVLLLTENLAQGTRKWCSFEGPERCALPCCASLKIRGVSTAHPASAFARIRNTVFAQS